MENGIKLTIPKMEANVRKRDLDVHLHCGLVIESRFGSLLALRENLEKLGFKLIYCTNSSKPLYVVHFNDLSQEKQEQLRRGDKNG